MELFSFILTKKKLHVFLAYGVLSTPFPPFDKMPKKRGGRYPFLWKKMYDFANEYFT